MRSRWMAALTAFAMLGLAPSLASAEDVQQQLQQMQQRMQQMEQKLQAQDDELAAANQRVEEQSDLIETSGLVEGRGSSSGLGCFLCELTIGGWASASYWYNVNDPNDARNPFDPSGGFEEVEVVDPVTGLPVIDPITGSPVTEIIPGGGLGNTNRGFSGNTGESFGFYPLHPDHNTFSIDQLWFEVEKEISDENRAGFRADFLYGKSGALLSSTGPNSRDNRDDTALYLFQAYVQYLAPIGDGLTIKAGKFATLLGVEVPQTIYNYNITRSSLWNLLQPFDHIGVLGTYAFGDSGFSASVAGVNGFVPDSPDRNDGKSVMGQVGWAGDQFSVSAGAIYGPEGEGNDGNENLLLDGIIRWNPSDRFGMWINGNYATIDRFDNDEPAAWGIAAAGRVGITDRTGFSLRGEYLTDQRRYFNFVTVDDLDGDGFGGDATGVNIWGITGTVDHLLTDNLMVRAEARYDNINKDNGDDGEFFENNDYFDDLESDQIVVGIELIYNFSKFHGDE